MRDREFMRKLSNISMDVMNNKYSEKRRSEIKLVEKEDNLWEVQYLKEDGNLVSKEGTLKELIFILSQFEKQL